MMNRLVNFFIAIIFVSFLIQGGLIEPRIYYKINLDYDSGRVNISSVDIEFSQEEIENYFGFYTANVLDYNNKELDTFSFDIPTEILWDGFNPKTGKIEESGIMTLNQTSTEIFIPYYENAKEIIIYNENLDEVTRKDVSEYSKQRPTKKEEAIEDEGEVKKKSPETQTLTEKLVKSWWIFLIVFVALILILIYLLRKK